MLNYLLHIFSHCSLANGLDIIMNTICTVEGKRHSLVTIHRNKKRVFVVGGGGAGGGVRVWGAVYHWIKELSLND